MPFEAEVTLLGQSPDLSTPQTALECGIGLVARDRTKESVAMSLTIRENTFFNPHAVGRKRLSFMSPQSESEFAMRIGDDVALP